MLKSNQCSQCGAPIEPRFKTCYNCFEARTAGYTNRCARCGKPIDNKYAQCYKCAHAIEEV